MNGVGFFFGSFPALTFPRAILGEEHQNGPAPGGSLRTSRCKVCLFVASRESLNFLVYISLGNLGICKVVDNIFTPGLMTRTSEPWPTWNLSQLPGSENPGDMDMG